MVKAAELAVNKAFKGGLWVGGETWDVQVLVPFLFVEAVLNAVIGVDGKCDVEEVDCA